MFGDEPSGWKNNKIYCCHPKLTYDYPSIGDLQVITVNMLGSG